jgi:FixJ family two-component response regulator
LNINAQTPAPMICVVDNDRSILSALQGLLASDGLNAETFDNPKAFLDYARKQEVGLALLDVSMPQMNGIEVQRQLRAFSPQTRTIIMSGRDRPAIRAAAFEAGALMFLVKPCVAQELLAAVHNTLR